MKKIPLTQGYEATVDDIEFAKFSCYKWSVAILGGNTPYAMRKSKAGKTIYLHRQITDAPKGKVVDHIDGDSLNNRLSNLRVCSQAENVRNRKNVQKNNTSGQKGVMFRKDRRKWIVVAWKNYKRKQFGSFDNKEEAINHYKLVIAGFHENFTSTH